MKIFLYGQFGRGNIGDDLMFLHYKSSSPKNVKFFKFFKLKYLKNFFPSNNYIKNFPMIFFADKYVVTGGNQANFESIRSYLKISFQIVVLFIRKLFRKRNQIFSFGSEFQYTSIQLFLVKHFLLQFDEIHVRDKKSYNYIQQNITKTNIFLSFDTGFIYLLDNYKKNIKKTFNSSSKIINKPIFYFLSHHSGLSFNSRKEYLNQVAKENKNIIVFAQSKEDKKLASELSKKIKIKVVAYDFYSLDNFIKLLSDSSKIITERFHGLIFAYALNIRCEVRGNLPKLKNLWELERQRYSNEVKKFI
ncbi:MAG: polysaccharide pyruvyl transferase family protein [Gammaproteobacteria bacterium TMED112]|nr:MAG: polysaccharide pyruvyl transferase family protein [Gammaproteobacteria bacterium TMED112]|tara:strand:+ start:2332 stop:3243 length:912 start_codon:yes stop_codon:yes gene_type:complete